MATSNTVGTTTPHDQFFATRIRYLPATRKHMCETVTIKSESLSAYLQHGWFVYDDHMRMLGLLISKRVGNHLTAKQRAAFISHLGDFACSTAAVTVESDNVIIRV